MISVCGRCLIPGVLIPWKKPKSSYTELTHFFESTIEAARRCWLGPNLDYWLSGASKTVDLSLVS